MVSGRIRRTRTILNLNGAIAGPICVVVVVVVECVGSSGSCSQNIQLRAQIYDCYDKITVIRNTQPSKKQEPIMKFCFREVIYPNMRKIFPLNLNAVLAAIGLANQIGPMYFRVIQTLRRMFAVGTRAFTRGQENVKPSVLIITYVETTKMSGRI